MAHSTLKGVVALKGTQNVGKTTEIKHLCLYLLKNHLATCVVPKTAPLKKLNANKGEANLVLLYKGKRVGVRGSGDATRDIQYNFSYFEKKCCEFGITAVRKANPGASMSAAEIAFDVEIRKRTIVVKPVAKTVKGDAEIQDLIDALDQLIMGK